MDILTDVISGVLVMVVRSFHKQTDRKGVIALSDDVFSDF